MLVCLWFHCVAQEKSYWVREHLQTIIRMLNVIVTLRGWGGGLGVTLMSTLSV